MKRTMLLCWLILTLAAVCRSALDQPSAGASGQPFDRRVSEELFLELEELSRLTAISYCVGSTGIQKPFQCLNRCSDFEHVELVEVRRPAPRCAGLPHKLNATTRLFTPAKST